MNVLWATLVRFEPYFFNPMTGRTGQYRVEMCVPTGLPARLWSLFYCKDSVQMVVMTTKPFRKGVIIRPHKEVLRTRRMIRE